jgi:hypothetical protein
MTGLGSRAIRVLRARRSSRRRSLGVASSRARFAVRAAQVRRRPWLMTAWLAAVLALLAGGAWLVELSPVLAVRSVRVCPREPSATSPAGLTS